jgi:hypothetical protein
MIRKRRLLPRKNIPARQVQDTVDRFGRPQIGQAAYTNFELKNCTVQPYVGDDLIVADTGFETKEAFTIFTETSASIGEEDSIRKPDEVFIFDAWYRVVKVKPWQNSVIPHYEVVVVKITLRSP